MAGVLANSTSVVHSSSSAEDTNGGYLIEESVTLTTSPTGTTYAWALGKPSGATARSNLSGSTGASVSFTPDVAGYYTIVCTVDSSTVYILRISVLNTAASTAKEAVRYQPITDAQVSAPALGRAKYFSTGRGHMAQKNPAGAECFAGHPGDVGADLADTDETITLAQGSFRYLPASTLTTTRTKTLGTSGAAIGHVIVIHKMDDAETLAVANAGVGGGSWSYTGKHYVVFRFDGTDWAPWERYDLT